MSLTQELRRRHEELWDRVVNHPFVLELGADTLPLEKFKRYFLQDYVFFRDFVSLLALGVAKAPDLNASRHLAAFLAEVLQGEEQLFQGSFEQWGLEPEEYSRPAPSPPAAAFGDLMARVAYEGAFAEIMTVLVVTEWVYLDWATRAADLGRPDTPVYRAWTEIHSNEEFRKFVLWLLETLDGLDLSAEQEQRVRDLFHATLRYELAFWELGYNGGEWPV